MVNVRIPRALALMFACSMALVACVTMTIDDVGKLRKGMSVEEAKAVLPIPPRNVFAVETNDSAIQVQVCVYVLSSGSYGSNYFLSFENNKLTFWGYPQEYARSTDPRINDIGEKTVAMLKKLDSTY